jgi:hypothetical protein
VKLRHAAVAVLVLVSCGSRALAQSRPLATEDPETIGAGQILIEGGYDYQYHAVYPASGLTGNLSRVGTFGINFGVSSLAELQLKTGLQDWLSVSERVPAPLSSMLTFKGTTTRDFMDAVIGAKVRFASETVDRPSMAVKFSTRLPNAGNESGLGLDTTDFNFSFLIAKTVRSVRFAGNVGLGILGDPVRGDEQNDVLTYGISAARAVANGIELVADFSGRISTRDVVPVGTETRSMVRLGARFTSGPVRFDAAFLIGATKNDPLWGVTTGFTWVFKAFTVPPQ